MRRAGYLGLMLAVALLAIGGAAAFSYAMDPYGLFRPGEGARPVLEADIAQKKLYQAVGRGADVVVLGNSRADIGFDPRHSFLSGAGKAAHNLAVPGGGIETSAAQFEALCNLWPVKRAVLGVDFIDFIRLAEKPPEHFVDTPMRTQPSLGQRARALVSAEAVSDSARAVWASRSRTVSLQTPEGLNLLNSYEADALRSGYHPFFQQRLEETAKRWTRGRWVLVRDDESAALALRRLIDTATRCGTNLIIVTYPYHLQYLALLREAGLWDEFEAWKRQLVATVDGAAPSKRVRLVDFATVTPNTGERVPVRGELSYVPQLYWESGHFKRGLGDRILSALEAPTPAAAGGIDLVRDTLEAYLRAQQSALSSALADDPQLVGEIHKALRRPRSGD